ncbi:transposase [Streptomyces sp. NPDC050619]|uniref:transposase n=1 Tax=Streptomyces sp. NPDC050619 TaxID=3157214 RepID=UPI003429A4DC
MESPTIVQCSCWVLSDRQAAEAVRCRINFKYALAMELDDPDFHHSVLADFRDRIAQDAHADRLLDLALTRLKEAGLVRERTHQRTDSTHVLAAVRDLTRLEPRRCASNRHPAGRPATRSATEWKAPSKSSLMRHCRYRGQPLTSTIKIPDRVKLRDVP